MKSLRIQVKPFNIKGDLEEMDELKQEVANELMLLLERDEIEFDVLDEDDEEEED